MGFTTTASPEMRSPEEERALRALYGDGGFASWERTIANAPTENRPGVLERALPELLRLATKARVAHVDISDWATRIGELHRIADADGMRSILAGAVENMANGSASGTSRSNRPEPKDQDGSTTNFASCASFAWPVMDDAAFHGILGDIVQTISPHSEADPVALLLQSLTLAGNVVGRLPHYRVQSDEHRANLFVVLVGASAKGRKGTSLGRIRSIVKVADETWSGDRTKGGLSSGEGFISEVRDPVQKYDSKEKSSRSLILVSPTRGS
jgi:hypothetical protein